jgi:hypothetical protein
MPGRPQPGGDGADTGPAGTTAEAGGDATGTGAPGATAEAGAGGPAGQGGMDDDGWQTSNQLPEGGAPGDSSTAGTAGQSGPGTGDPELDGVLADLDEEILAERAVIRARSNETAGTGAEHPSLPQGHAGGGTVAGSEGGDAQGSEAGSPLPDVAMRVPPARSEPPRPSPAVVAGNIPDDIPKAARDDDIIARQLREAAMNEPDPELREKLWDEYRRYKGI